MSVNLARYAEDDCETISLHDQAHNRSDYLTEAQLRIKALKDRNREKQLKDDLLSHAAEIRQKWSNIAAEKTAKADQSAIRRQMKDCVNREKLDLKPYLSAVRESPNVFRNETSAIEKQKQALAEKLENQFDSNCSTNHRKLKWAKLKSIGQRLKRGNGSYFKFRRGKVA